ncbi:MAG: hypothetical protein ABSG56_18360 [Bryobacteraceae bacterium]
MSKWKPEPAGMVWPSRCAARKTKHHAERATQHIGGFARRKDERFFGVEVEAQPPEFERHSVALRIT